MITTKTAHDLKTLLISHTLKNMKNKGSDEDCFSECRVKKDQRRPVFNIYTR